MEVFLRLHELLRLLCLAKFQVIVEGGREFLDSFLCFLFIAIQLYNFFLIQTLVRHYN